MTDGQIQRIAVIGAGTMGHGIALVFARSGLNVTIYDAEEEVRQSVETKIRRTLENLPVQANATDDTPNATMKNVSVADSLAAAVQDSHLVIEAVPEDINLKSEVLAKIDTQAPERAVLASNTSGFSITELGGTTDRPDRVLGTHWFNPPYIVPLVEVIKGDHTEQTHVDAVAGLLEDLGKTTVVVEKDVPGFIADRLQIAMIYEAYSLLDKGVASAEDIDKAVQAGFGLRAPALGIFKQQDFAGLDVELDVIEYLVKQLDRGVKPSRTLSEHVENGELGVKTGTGIYDWREIDRQEIIAERDEQLLDLTELYEETIKSGRLMDLPAR